MKNENLDVESVEIGEMKKIHILDSSTLEPEDRVTVIEETSMVTEGDLGNKDKRIIGRPKVYDLDGNLLAEEENLVVMGGREIVAALISGMAPELSNYKINYVSIGTGGTDSNNGVPSTVGPFDNDTTLANPVQIGISSDSDTSTNDYKYIGDGYLKRIQSDGSIVVSSEDHLINGPTGQITVSANTVITYNITIQKDEPVDKPVKFNEAGLYAVEYINGIPSKTNHILFARFTTLDKYLDIHDGIIIEWNILV
jgi:hypothetical protein